MAEFPTLSDIFEPIEGKTGTEANEQMRLWYAGTRQLPGAAPSEAITIVDDVIAPTSADVIVDTEGQAPADDLQIIKPDSTHDGMILSLRAANPDRVVTVVATGQLNGITLWNRAERYVLSTTEQLVLQRDGSMWREVRGIGVALADDQNLTLENTEEAARASQLASLYFRTATLEGAVAALGNGARCYFFNDYVPRSANNIAAITRTGVGNFTIPYLTPFNSPPVCSATGRYTVRIVNSTTTQCQILIFDYTGTAADPTATEAIHFTATGE